MNCMVVDDEETSRMVVKDFIERTDSLTLIAECDNAVDAYNVLRDEHIDTLFLDIEMPKMTGIELVQALEDLPQVILITGRPDFGAEAFEYSLTDYLVKPINYPRFLKAVDKARKNLDRAILETKNKDDIYVKSDNKIVRINLKDIYFIEALSDYVIINTQDKKHIVHSTMKGIEKRLESADFIRVHRSYIINISKIDTIEDMSTIVMPQKPIPIGASYKNRFMAKLNFL